jgi:hypothetical protein
MLGLGMRRFGGRWVLFIVYPTGRYELQRGVGNDMVHCVPWFHASMDVLAYLGVPYPGAKNM